MSKKQNPSFLAEIKTDEKITNSTRYTIHGKIEHEPYKITSQT